MVAEQGWSFDLLHDAGNGTADAFGLTFTLPEDLRAVYRGFGIDLEAANGDGSWRLPMPARYVVDAKGRIRDAAVHPDYTRRPEPDATLEVLGEPA